jgi:hypothetical protein
VEQKAKPKTRGPAAPSIIPVVNDEAMVDTPSPIAPAATVCVDKRAYRVFKTLFHVPSSETGDLPKEIKWDEFKRAMTRAEFSAEKLQGSAWQFSPGGSINVERGMQFHEPHPENEIPHILARRFGRRLERVYGWSSETFRLS